MSLSPTKSLRSHGRSGFALIITVVLVAFLVLILVGLATFTRVETQVADNTADLAKARQNAMTGLNIALGQLQRHAGPDDRVTATSELVGGITPQNQNYFTGVWQTSGSISSTPDAWLVSGNEGTASQTSITGIAEPNPTPAVTRPYDDATDTVFVVYNASVGATSAAERQRRIRLVRQPITVPTDSLPGLDTPPANTTIGHYAYWVGDEGVKASVSVSAPDFSTLNYDNSGTGGDDWNSSTPRADPTVPELGDVLRRRLAQFAQPYRRIDQIFSGINPSNPTTASELGRVLSVEQIRLVDNGVVPLADFKSKYHDITAFTRGVLARTDSVSASTPRLRRDWSARVGAVADSLNDYWVTRPVEVDNTIISPTPPDRTFSAVYDVARSSTSTGSGLSFAVAPVLTEAGFFFTFGQDGSGYAELQCIVLAEFWNPYASTLRATSARNLRVRLVKTTAAPLVFTVDDSTTGTPVTHTITLNTANQTIASATFGGTEEFPPGSVVQYLTSNSPTFAASGTGVFGTGFNSGMAVTTPPLVNASLPAVASDDFHILLEENTTGTWLTLQTFSLDARDPASGLGLAPSAGGYGFELHRDFERWSSATAGDARDPRSGLTFTDANYQPITDPTAHWTNDPSQTADPNGLADSASAPFIPSTGSPANPIAILFDLPRQEITNLAQLRHMIGERPYEIMRGSGAANSNDREIFDTTFVSTVPRNHPAWNFETEARPNAYLEVYVPPRAPTSEFGTVNDRRDRLREEVNSARYQLIKGAFNINSTSIEAWKAVLGASLSDWDTHIDSPSTTTTGTNVSGAFFRVPHGAQEKGLDNLVISDVQNGTPADTSDDAPAAALLSNTNTLTAVGRRLTPNEVADLATEIVTKLKARGRPFASLGEFVASNILGDAIRDANSGSGPNAGLSAEYRYSAGAITPGDIIAGIAPFMSARSDTFKIRAYGDTQNPVTGDVTARAWCEVIVQRVPDLAEEPDAVVNDVVVADPATYPFGRKFEIVSFRWLNTDDI